jgi:hypothetical protein
LNRFKNEITKLTKGRKKKQKKDLLYYIMLIYVSTCSTLTVFILQKNLSPHPLPPKAKQPSTAKRAGLRLVPGGPTLGVFTPENIERTGNNTSITSPKKTNM